MRRERPDGCPAWDRTLRLQESQERRTVYHNPGRRTTLKMTNATQQPREGIPAQPQAAETRPTSLWQRLCAMLRNALCPEVALVDLCDFPALLKPHQEIATFFRECSEEFPGSREICLPSSMADIVLVSPPPTREVLRLLKKLGRNRRVVLSNRLLPESMRQVMTLETILFQ